MSQYIRYRRPGACVFFTVNLAQRGSCLLVEEIDRLRWAVATTRRDRPFGVEAWVVLPDHMHSIWKLPEGDADYATRWRLIKGRFSAGLASVPRSASKMRQKEKGLWQRRFWEHHIRDDADMDLHLRYCWGDPVKHGYVERAADWPYSSLHRDASSGELLPGYIEVSSDRCFGE